MKFNVYTHTTSMKQAQKVCWWNVAPSSALILITLSLFHHLSSAMIQ